MVVLLSLVASVATAEPTCDETLEACDLYVTQLEEQSDLQEEKLKLQAQKIKQLEKDKQSWFFLCNDKVTCTLLGIVVGAVAWEAVR